MRTEGGDADAASHDKAVHESDERFGVFVNFGVQAVFEGPEALAEREIACSSRIVEVNDIAPRRKGAVALSFDHHQRDVVVIGPLINRSFDGLQHAFGQRVQSLGALQGDAARAAFFTAPDLTHNPRSASTARLMMTRMISFVPSRIWWTRRSRTIFSMP